LRRIYSSYNLAAVHHARNLLEAAGIRAVVKNEFLSSAMGELPPAECQVELWVLDDEDAARAERLLHNAAGTQSDPDWACTACGELSGPQFTQCWRCGTYRHP
jgi:hypothetical protein